MECIKIISQRQNHLHNAPGLDEMLAKFFLDHLSTCNDDIIQLVMDCLDTLELPPNINNSLITLIPKVNNPLSIKQMRPISLCNPLYKVISKIIMQ